jgi:hypothetical protein
MSYDIIDNETGRWVGNIPTAQGAKEYIAALTDKYGAYYRKGEDSYKKYSYCKSTTQSQSKTDQKAAFLRVQLMNTIYGKPKEKL